VIKAHSQLLSRRSTSTQQGFSAWMRFWEFPRLRTETAGRANPVGAADGDDNAALASGPAA